MSNNFEDLPSELLPRDLMERAADPSTIPDEALLSIILKTGAAGCDVRELSRRLLDAFGSLNKLISSDWRDIEERIKKHNKDYPDRPILGIGRVKCLELAAAFEMGRRANRMSPEEMRNSSVMTPDDGFRLFRAVIRPGEEKESMFVLLLDVKNHPLSEPIRMSIGSDDYAPACVRDIFKEAVRWGAKSIMVAHNHPSGDPTPSRGDIELTRRVVEAAKLFDINVVDHLVIATPRGHPVVTYISIKAYQGQVRE